jgi:hypothetical protein
MGLVWHLDVGLEHPGAVDGSKGLAILQEKRYMILKRRETVWSLSITGDFEN